MTVLALYVDANARTQGHRHLLVRPPGIFCCAKALGLGTHFGAKAPGCPGGMVTGQIDTCISLLVKAACQDQDVTSWIRTLLLQLGAFDVAESESKLRPTKIFGQVRFVISSLVAHIHLD